MLPTMLRIVSYLMVISLVLSFALEAGGETGFPDSLYLPRLEVKSARAAGSGQRVSPGGILRWGNLKGPGIIRHIWMGKRLFWMHPSFRVSSIGGSLRYTVEEYADGSWTWLWPRGFRNFPARMERIWDENIEIAREKKFRQNFLFRLFRRRINIPASFGPITDMKGCGTMVMVILM